MMPIAIPMPAPALCPALPSASAGAGTNAVPGEFAALFDLQTGELPAPSAAGKGDTDADPSERQDEPAVMTEIPTPPIAPTLFPQPAGRFGIVPLGDASVDSGQPVQPTPLGPGAISNPAPARGTERAPALTSVLEPAKPLLDPIMAPPLLSTPPPLRDHAVAAGEEAAPPGRAAPPLTPLLPMTPDAGAAPMPVAELAARIAAAGQETIGAAEVPAAPDPAASGPAFASPTAPPPPGVAGASPVQPAPPATPLPVLAVDAAMAERLAAEIGRGTDAPLKFRLTPERLGPLEITLGQRADGSQLLRIVTATAAAGDAMLAHSSALADAVQRHIGAPVQVAIERAPEQQDRGQPARGDQASGHPGQQGQSAAYSHGQAGQHGKSPSPANLWRGRAVNQTEAPSTITHGDAAGRATHLRARYA